MLEHYVIANVPTPNGPKLHFGKVTGTSRGILTCVEEKYSHIPKLRRTFETAASAVVLDLGKDPHPGSVYGFDVVNRHWKTKDHDDFGSVSFLYRIDKEVAKNLWAAFTKAASILKKHDLIIPAGESIWQVMPPQAKGKYAGFFKASKDVEKAPHIFAIKPESVEPNQLVYIILHEYAHWLHASCITQPDLNAKWVTLFNRSIKVGTFRKELCVSILTELLAGEERPSDFRSGLDEEQRNAFNWIVRVIKADHALSLAELDLLFEGGMKDEIKAVWPQRTLHKKDLQPHVSEYATVSYKELFAEAVSFHLQRTKLPEGVTKLVEKTLRIAKTNQ